MNNLGLPPEWKQPATQEQLELMRQLGLRIESTQEISRGAAQATIDFHQATDRQIAYLKCLGIEIDRPITKRRASELITRCREGGKARGQAMAAPVAGLYWGNCP